MEWLPLLDQFNSLASLEQHCLQCHDCSLRDNAHGVVFGDGTPDARLMFVGEAPGADEDRLGKPFVGAAGQLLEKIMGSVGLERGNVYITNICKCRPPGNRLPKKEEADRCFLYLVRQIELIQPRLIVCLGALSTKYLIHPDAGITAVRGKIYEKGGIKIVPTFHPAALLRDASKKKPVWEDFKKIRELYDQE
jgi:DNA polymerase